MNSQPKSSTKSETPSTAREPSRTARSATSTRNAEERPWWSLGDWRAAMAEPEFVLA